MATEINIIQVLPNANLMFSITVIINKKRERNTAIYKYTRKHQVNVCFKESVERLLPKSTDNPCQVK